MRERVGVHVAGHLPLNAIVTDGRRGIEPRLEIAGLEDALPLDGVAPYAGEAIRLQLESHRQFVRGCRVALLGAAYFLVDAE